MSDLFLLHWSILSQSSFSTRFFNCKNRPSSTLPQIRYSNKMFEEWKDEQLTSTANYFCKASFTELWVNSLRCSWKHDIFKYNEYQNQLKGFINLSKKIFLFNSDIIFLDKIRNFTLFYLVVSRNRYIYFVRNGLYPD